MGGQFALAGREFPEILPCDEVFTDMPVYGQAVYGRNKERACLRGLRAVREKKKLKPGCACVSTSH